MRSPHEDPRRNVGARVHTKSTHVTSLAECSRLYGSLAKTKLVDGTVSRVIDRSMKRARTFLEAHWKQPLKLVAISNIIAGPTPETLAAEALSEIDIERVEELINQESWDQTELLDDDSPARMFAGEEPDISPSVVASVHDVDWHAGKVETIIGGPTTRRMWSVRTCVSDVIREGAGISNKKPYFYFLSMFPHNHLLKMVSMTNSLLRKRTEKDTTAGELFKFIGILILMTPWEFGSRRDLWTAESNNSLLPVSNFGKREWHAGDLTIYWLAYDSVSRVVRMVNQTQLPQGGASCKISWMHLTNTEHVTPSEIICVDESISRWYGLGGDWIDIGLPHYVAIDRKPENGCEIQNSACGRSGIMLHIELVSSADDEAGREYEGDGLHGTAALRRVVKNWAGTGRIVCADSYYASVEACEELEKIGLKFIRVVKTATRRFPMKYLSELERKCRGDWHSVVRKDADNKVNLMALVWMDRERRYFVANASSTLRETPYKRIRWRELTDGPARQELTIDQPEVAEVYYKACAKIDQHNRCRQKDLMLERKVRNVDWSFRANCSTLGIVVVDSWLLYSGERGDFPKMTQRQFYEQLSYELVFNNYNEHGLRTLSTHIPCDMESVTLEKPTSGIGMHLTPTKRRRKRRGGGRTPYALQMCCTICKRKKTHLCSDCTEKDTWLCHTSSQRL